MSKTNKIMTMDEKLMTNPYYAKAIEYIRTTDLNALENGKHFIDVRATHRYVEPKILTSRRSQNRPDPKQFHIRQSFFAFCRKNTTSHAATKRKNRNRAETRFRLENDSASGRALRRSETGVRIVLPPA